MESLTEKLPAIYLQMNTIIVYAFCGDNSDAEDSDVPCLRIWGGISRSDAQITQKASTSSERAFCLSH